MEVSMKCYFKRFNIYLMIMGLAIALPSCATTDSDTKAADAKAKANETEKEDKKVKKIKDKWASTLRFHLEVNPDGTNRNYPIHVMREDPITINVNGEPLLTEAQMEKAELLDVMDTPTIKIIFSDPEGVRSLEYVTTAYKGQRLAIYSDFGQKRWLAAPQINKRIADGIFLFTPDANKEECERIVRGLNNMIVKIKKKK